MAIIKNGRINIWNAVKKQFEVVHPETETARITDFADGIVQKLALTSAMTAVTALQTDSWFGKLLKMALTASGVKYNIAQNGYIRFGEFFGGLIIQWGMCSGTTDKQDKWFQAFPLSAFKCFSVSLTRCGGNGTYVVKLVRVVNNGFYWIDANSQDGAHGSGDPNLWIAIGQ